MPNVPLVDANVICTARQLGEVLALSMRQIHHLESEGILRQARSKLNGKRYRLAESVQAYLRYQREYVTRECSKGNAAYDLARTRRMQALAAKEELELQKARGEVLNRAHVLLVLTNAVTTMKNHVLAIASRCSRRVLGLKTQAEVHAVIHPECERSLTEIANIDSAQLVEQTFKHGKNDV